MLGIWMAAVLLNVLTDSYPMILLSMSWLLGASTMLNTTVNLLTPMVCAGYAGMMVNIFFFIQESAPAEASSCWEDMRSAITAENDQWRAFGGRTGEPGLVCHGEFETRKEQTKPKTIKRKSHRICLGLDLRVIGPDDGILFHW